VPSPLEMAYLRRADISQTVDIIRRSSNGVQSVLFLTAPSVDALCALKILTNLLTSEFIPFKVEPVSSYGELEALNTNLFGGKSDPENTCYAGDLSAIVLIECGGTIDLGKILIPPTNLSIVVLDSHRPIALENLLGNSQVLFLDDGFVSQNERDLKEAFEALSYPPQELADESDQSESEAENTDPQAAGNKDSKKKLSKERRVILFLCKGETRKIVRLLRKFLEWGTVIAACIRNCRFFSQN
jgi:cell division control protein 45